MYLPSLSRRLLDELMLCPVVQWDRPYKYFGNRTSYRLRYDTWERV